MIRWRLNTLFWKIFLTIWLVSSLAMAGIFLFLANRDDQARWQHIIDSQFRQQAETLIRQYESGQLSDPKAQNPPLWIMPRRISRYYPDRHFERDFVSDWLPGADRPGACQGASRGGPPGDHRKAPRPTRSQPPVWLYQLQPGSDRLGAQVTGHRQPAPERAFTLDLTADSGQRYRLLVEMPPRLKHKKHVLGYLFSLQMLLVVTVAALSALILSLVLVRPIRQLSEHVKQIYHHGDLSFRASEQLSQRKDEIGDLTRDFDRMADFVENTLQSQQRLLQDVSHELRAPMARLQVSAGLAGQQLGDDSPLVTRINRECERLDGLIAEILSYSRLESASKSGERFALKSLFDELVADLRFSQPERPVKLAVMPESLQLNLNRDLLARALRNGLDNALKYTPADSVLELSAEQQAEHLVIRLRDHGAGIREELLAELFTPFVRGTGGHGEGYGLGMSIAWRAVRRLGGDLSAENHPQGGLQLTLCLPVTVIST